MVLLSLAIDPFLQQIVDVGERQTLVSQGTVPKVVRMLDNVVQEQDSLDFMAPLTQLITTMGHFYNRNAVPSNISAFCPNTDCTWPIFDTLSICSSCTDMSAELSFGCHMEQGGWKMNYSSSDATIGAEPTTSCGWFFNRTGDTPMLMTGYSTSIDDNRTAQALLMRQLNFRDPFTDEVYWNGSLAFKHVPNPLANFAVVASSDIAALYTNATPAAYECVMQLCTRTIAASYSQGRYEERILSEYRNMTRRVEPLTVGVNAAGFDYLYGQNVSIEPPGQSETFFASNVSMMELRFSFDRFLPSYLTLAIGKEMSQLRFNNEVDADQGQKSFDSSCTRWLKSGGIESSVHEMAQFMSVALRNTVHAVPVYGTGVFETFIRIRWSYASLPAVVLLFTAILLFSTIAQMSGSCPSRKSSLFTLMHGLSADARATLDTTYSMHELRQRARHIALFTNVKGDQQSLSIAEYRKAEPPYAEELFAQDTGIRQMPQACNSIKQKMYGHVTHIPQSHLKISDTF